MLENNLDFFTIVARNYLAYAYVLGDSIKQHHPDAKFSIFLMDDLDKQYKSEIESKGFSVIFPHEIEIDNYEQFVFKYNVTEACTGVKPFVIQNLIDKGAEKVIYIDPDILCFRRLHEVVELLEKYSIVITPHSNSPIKDEYFPNDCVFLTTGVYNLGFIAVRKSEITQRFIKWWSGHLLNECLDSVETGLFVDQKWIDLVPAYFEEVKIFKSLAYNIAYWNLHERTLYKDGELLKVFPSTEEVAFVHFSGIVHNASDEITKYKPRNPFNLKDKKRYYFSNRPDLKEPFELYLKLLLSADLKKYSSINYAFNTYENGENISILERRLYITSPEWQLRGINPFSTDKNSFWELCRSGIKEVKISASPLKLDEATQKKYEIVFQFIRLILKLALIIMGTNVYIKFAKYMQYQFLLSNHKFLLEKYTYKREE